MIGRLAAGLLLVVTAVGCSSLPIPSATASPTAALPGHYSDGTLSFDYPSAWQTGKFWYVSSFSSPIVFLSPQPLREPCTSSASSVACRNAIDRLVPSSVLVSWWFWGFPGFDFTKRPGDLTQVDGRVARLDNAPDMATCTSMGGEGALTLIVQDPSIDEDWIELDACWRGPDSDGTRSQIDALIASVRWASPEVSP